MKTLFALFLISVFSLSLTNTPSKSDKIDEIRQLIENKQFKFIARSANPRTGSQITLTSTYNLCVDSTSIEAWLPYFGRAYQAEYGRSDGGIKFNETAELIEIKQGKNNKNYQVEIRINTDKDYYKLFLNISLSGYASLDITSNHRQGISYHGIIEPLDDDE